MASWNVGLPILRRLREGSGRLACQFEQMRIRIRSTQAVVTVAAVALPLHLAGHKHHPTHPAGHASVHKSPGSGGARAPASGRTSGSSGARAPGSGRHSATSSHGSSSPTASAAHRRHHRAGGTHGARGRHHSVLLAVKAQSARDPGDTISDFKFTPGTLTIHAGDTVTWTNAGPSAHTATGSGFDTGVLAKGASASHTFTTAGTFPYVCTLHSFMHGTVVVLASTTTSTPGTATTPSGTTTTPTTTPTPTTSSGGLPNTGLDLAATVLCGMLLAAVGLLLRRPARGLPQSESAEDRKPHR